MKSFATLLCAAWSSPPVVYRDLRPTKHQPSTPLSTIYIHLSTATKTSQQRFAKWRHFRVGLWLPSRSRCVVARAVNTRRQRPRRRWTNGKTRSDREAGAPNNARFKTKKAWGTTTVKVTAPWMGFSPLFSTNEHAANEAHLPFSASDRASPGQWRPLCPLVGCLCVACLVPNIRPFLT